MRPQARKRRGARWLVAAICLAVAIVLLASSARRRGSTGDSILVLTVAPASTPTSSTPPTPSSTIARRISDEFRSNLHFSLDPAIMPDSFFEHLQFMGNKIAGKWKANSWNRFDKKDISQCASESISTGEAAGVVGNDKALPPGARIEGLPECSIWKAIPPTELAKGKGKPAAADESDDDSPEDNEPGRTRMLTAEQLDRPFRKCCAEHAKLRDTAFFVFDQLESNNITYFLSTGTALGAIRHNGTIIPWDTDVDIAIYPDDAPRAKALFKGLSKAEGGSAWRHFYSPDPQGKPMFWVHASKDGRPAGGPHVEIFYDAIYTSYPESLLPLVRCPFYGRQVMCPNPNMFKVWFPSGWQAYAGGHYHGKGRCTIYVKGVRIETDKC